MIRIFHKNKTGNNYSFLCQNIPLPIINCWRRLLLTDIRFSGIDKNDIKIIKNTTNQHDEYISHRLSMIPVKTTCYNALLQLNAINVEDKPKYVLSDSLQWTDAIGTVYPDMILASLKPGEELQLIARVKLGCMRIDGDGFRQFSACYFRKLSGILVQKNNLNQCQKICQYFEQCEWSLRNDKHLCAEFESKTHQCIGVSHNARSVDVMSLENYLNISRGTLLIQPSEHTYVFNIEYYFFTKSPMYIFKDCIQIVCDQLTNLKYKKVLFQEITKFKYKIRFEDKTIDSLLPLICKQLQSIHGMKFVQTTIDHPQQNYMDLYLFLNDTVVQYDEEIFRSQLQNAVHSLIDELNSIEFV